jgi:hypothetical protein
MAMTMVMMRVSVGERMLRSIRCLGKSGRGVREYTMSEHAGGIEGHVGSSTTSCWWGARRGSRWVHVGVRESGVGERGTFETGVEASTRPVREPLMEPAVGEGITSSSPVRSPSTLELAASRIGFFSNRSRSGSRGSLDLNEHTKNLSILNGKPESVLELTVRRHGNLVAIIVLVLQNEGCRIKFKQLAAQFKKGSKSVTIQGGSPNLTSTRGLNS